MRKTRYLILGRFLPCALLLLLFFAGIAYLAIEIPQALAPAALGERLLSLGVGIFVFLRAPAERRATRLLLLLFLPWVGAAVCLFLRGEEPLPRAEISPLFGSGEANAVLALSRGNAAGLAARCDYFSCGRDFADALFSDLLRAKERVYLEYYILARGKFFDTVLEILEQKAREGVAVKLVYDDFGCAATLPKDFPKRMKKRGIETEVFRPLRPFPLFRLHRRDHRKLALIDGRIAYLGGMNLSDEYVGEKVRFGHWKDGGVRVAGAPAARLAGETAEQGEIPCVFFSDGADRRPRTGEEVLLRLIGGATHSLLLFTPYFAPTERVFSALLSAVRAGVCVRLMIPHIPDKRSVFLLTRAYARRFERAGGEVREYTAGFLHAKAAAADGRRIVIGSYNLDCRSLLLQAENAVYIENEALCADFGRDFSSAWETGTPVKKPSLWERALGGFLRLFSHFL